MYLTLILNSKNVIYIYIYIYVGVYVLSKTYCKKIIINDNQSQCISTQFVK